MAVLYVPHEDEFEVQSLPSLEKEMATDSSILAWRLLWAEEPGRLQSMGSQRVGHDRAIHTPYPPSPYSLAGQTVYKVAWCPMYSPVHEQGKTAPSDRPLAQSAGSALVCVVWERP